MNKYSFSLLSANIMIGFFLKSALAASLEKQTTTTDTSIYITESTKVDKRDICMNGWGCVDPNNTISYPKPRYFGGLTFTRIDWGFSRPMDNGSFTMSEPNKFLTYGKASNFGFDVLQFGARFNDAFKIYISTGFEWNYMRLQNQVVLRTNSTPLAHDIIDVNEVGYKRNFLTSTYLRIPVTFEWRSPQNAYGKRFKVAVSPTTGILLRGSQKIRSKELGRQTFRNNFNLQSFQYGGIVRIGYDKLGVFGNYYLSDMFEKSPDQKGFRNFAFGLTLGF